jgi:hypothetical protein
MLVSLSMVFLMISFGNARNILERKMFYLTNANKVAQAKYWVVYLGNYPVKLKREIAGEGLITVDGSVNFQLLSSGYVEGNGFGSKGKIECLPSMSFNNGEEEKHITIDSIDFIFDFGRKVCLKSGQTGALIIDVEGTALKSKKFLLREYKLTEVDGEKSLKEVSQETPIMALALTQEGISRAQKAQQILDQEQETASDK